MTGKYTTELINKLPKLPLPELSDTLSRLTEWLTPLLGTAEQAKLAQLISDFEQTDAPYLQAKLVQHWQETNASWLAPLWRTSYLTSRAPIQSSSNFALTIAPTSLPELEPIVLAARLLQNFAKQYYRYASEEAPVETTRSGMPLDMSYYQNFFRTQRLPQPNQDRLAHYRPTLTDVEVTVIVRNTVYQLQVIDHDGQIASLSALTENLRNILALQKRDSFFIGSYTGLDRDTAAEIHDQLRADPLNRANLNRISNSILALTLANREESASLKRTLLGPHNQFFDKTLQLVLDGENGLGIAFEHSDIDGVPALNLISEVVNDLSHPDHDQIGISQVTELNWHLNHFEKEALVEAEHHNQTIADQLEFAAAAISTFGKTQLKALGVSPDAFFHTALALAEYRITGGWRSIYEPVSMRGFYQGRTENARGINAGKKAFVEAFTTDQRDDTVKAAFDTAVAEHSERIKLAQQGFGVERHLLGLREMMLANGGANAFTAAAAFFNSDLLAQLQTDFFSTTGIPYDIIDNFSFAPTSEDGYGIYYGILADKILLTVSAWVTNAFNAKELADVIVASTQEVFDWLSSINH